MAPPSRSPATCAKGGSPPSRSPPRSPARWRATRKARPREIPPEGRGIEALRRPLRGARPHHLHQREGGGARRLLRRRAAGGRRVGRLVPHRSAAQALPPRPPPRRLGDGGGGGPRLAVRGVLRRRRGPCG